MAFQPVPSTAKLTWFLEGNVGGPLEGCEAQFAFYVRDTFTNPPWPINQLNLLRDYGVAWWDSGKNAGPAAKSFVSIEWERVKVEARDLTTQAGAVVINAVNSPGTRAGDPISPSCPLLIRYSMNPGGFPRIGRLFFPCGVEGDIIGEDFNGTFAGSVVNCFSDFNSDLNDGLAGGFATWAQVRVSRHSGTHVWGSDPDDPPLPKLPNKRASAETNTLALIGRRDVVASQRDRRSTD